MASSTDAAMPTLLLRINQSQRPKLLQLRPDAGVCGRAYDGWLSPQDTVMSDPEFAALRRHMVAQIAVHTILLTSRLGKASLDRRVLEVMG